MNKLVLLTTTAALFFQYILCLRWYRLTGNQCRMIKFISE